MIKEQIISLLSADSLNSYLSGMELLEENISKPTLPDSDLDQDIMERACAVLILEKWAQHKDYFSELKKMMDVIPNHKNLLDNEDVGHYLRGLSIFIDGLSRSQYDLSGFIYVSNSGWIMSMTAAEQIAEYCTEKQDHETAAVFTDIAAFFKRINNAQFGIVSKMMGIQSWNESMADGFYNIMTAADISTQSWMLGSLYKVIKDPVVKNSIFGKYLAVLKKVKAKFKAEDNQSGVSDIESLLEIVIKKSKGK